MYDSISEHPLYTSSIQHSTDSSFSKSIKKTNLVLIQHHAETGKCSQETTTG